MVRLLNVARESFPASRLSRDAVLYRRPHAVVCFDVSRVKAPCEDEWSIGLRPGAVKRRTPSGTSRERSLGLSRMRRISSKEGRARERGEAWTGAMERYAVAGCDLKRQKT